MWQLITGFMPDTPPQSARCGFILPDGNLKEFWTYGALLLEDNSDNNLVDAGLRNMVSWCMGAQRFSFRVCPSLNGLTHWPLR